MRGGKRREGGREGGRVFNEGRERKGAGGRGGELGEFEGLEETVY